LPYILETIWLLAGYQLARGALSPVDILLIWLIAQAGRQTGSLVLYFSGVYGLPPLRRFFKRFIEPRMPKRQIIPSNLARSLADPSPFSIASARLVGLRIPIALLMSARQRLFPLVLGVLISSIVWDGAYLIVGSLVGATVATQPVNMLLYSLGGLTVLYLIVLSIRYLIRSRVHRKENQP